MVSDAEILKNSMRRINRKKMKQFQETYIQRPKNWNFKETDKSGPLSLTSRKETERTLPAAFSKSARRELSVLGSQVKMKKGNYSVNIDGYLSDRNYDNQLYSLNMSPPSLKTTRVVGSQSSHIRTPQAEPIVSPRIHSSRLPYRKDSCGSNLSGWTSEDKGS